VSPPDSQTASRILARYLLGVEGGAPADFEALCEEHPERAEELRGLKADLERVEDVLEGLGGIDSGDDESRSLAGRLASRFGSDVDPSITLEAEGEADPEFAKRALGRLAEHAGGSVRYRAKGEVGRGGMGAVLRVWDEDLRRHLAMKVVLGEDAKHLARFLEEAQVTSQLDHPGIVPVHELGLDAEGQVYFTMKLVKGRTLREVIELASEEREGWSRTRVLEVVLKICDAMAYAHDKGVIHRDLKPANIMVGRFGAVYVMDWGLARIQGREDPRDVRILEPESPSSSLRSVRQDETDSSPDSPLVTMDGDVVGTPAYMSPEQAEGRLEALGPRTDVYALGAVLYHVLCGHMPYVKPGTKASTYAIWHWVRTGPPEPLHTAAPEVPAELVSICEKAMAREPGARFASMEALADDLRAYLEGRVVRTYETGAWAETRKWVRRNKLLAASVAAALLALIAGIATTLVLRQRAERSAELARESAELARENAEEAK